MRFMLNINNLLNYHNAKKYISLKVTFRPRTPFGQKIFAIGWLWWPATTAGQLQLNRIGIIDMTDNQISSSPPLWRKILEGIQDDFQNSLGYPATLRRRLNNGNLPVSHPQLRNTFWLRSVICWQTWLEYEKHRIRYLRLGHDGDFDYLQRHIPQLDGLINSKISESFCCDITAVGGLSASRDCDQDLSSLDAVPQQCCQELAIPLTRDRLNRNLSHHGLRLSEMVFSQFTWMPGRLYWNNVDGAHHFAAARFLVMTPTY